MLFNLQKRLFESNSYDIPNKEDRSPRSVDLFFFKLHTQFVIYNFLSIKYETFLPKFDYWPRFFNQFVF
jgi:hypothetical protein